MNDIKIVLTAHAGEHLAAYGEPDSILFAQALIVNGTHITIDNLSDEDRNELHSGDYRDSEYQVRAAMLELSGFAVLILHDPTEAVRNLFTLEQLGDDSDDYTLHVLVQTITIHTGVTA